MRKLLVSVALATAGVAAAVPAVAQPGQHHGYNQRGPDRGEINQLIRQLNQIDVRIDRQANRGNISRREAISLNRQANQIRNRLVRSGRNGLSRREFAELRIQVNRLEQNLRLERRDRDNRRG